MDRIIPIKYKAESNMKIRGRLKRRRQQSRAAESQEGRKWGKKTRKEEEEEGIVCMDNGFPSSRASAGYLPNQLITSVVRVAFLFHTNFHRRCKIKMEETK